MLPGIYLFKEEFWKEHNIPKSQWERRSEDLLVWISNFYDYEILEGRPIRIKINAVIGEYQPLPRKKYTSEEREFRLKSALKDYEIFTIAVLGTEFKPNSKAKIAKDAIVDFGYEKYSH